MSIAAPRAAGRPPIWLIVVTAAMAAVLLLMSVTETSFKGQYLIDEGESLSLVGLAFILVAGLVLHRRGQLPASLWLVAPWLLYPIITQGDQIIDNLSITWMRIVVHVLLALIFGVPVAVIVVAARAAFGWRRGGVYLTVALLAGEIWVAYAFLGTLMMLTLAIMIIAVLYVGPTREAGETRRWRTPAVSLAILVIGVAGSASLYLVFKNRPGAYQGSPSVYMDPSQPNGGFTIDRTVISGRAPEAPPSAPLVQEALNGYAHALEKLLSGYYILDRNYNYHFHNELFLRSTPLIDHYRQAGLGVIAEARPMAERADAAAREARATLAVDDPLVALLGDMHDYVAYNFGRAAMLERLSGAFEQTKAGLQHATHIYEGEGKYLGVQLAGILDKHKAVLQAAALKPIVGEFVSTCTAVHDKYADRIVGF